MEACTLDLAAAQGAAPYDAIVVPGGGIDRETGEPPEWVRRRLDAALEVARAHGGPDFTRSASDEFIITLSAGTTHLPPLLDESGFPVFESVAAARYLTRRGFPARRVLTECASYDTIGNAYFARVMHLEPRALRRLLIVTSEFHMARTRAIFEWVLALAPSPAQAPYELAFLPVSDAGLDALLAPRRQREAASLLSVRANAARIGSMRELHAFLFEEHAAYAVAVPPAPQRATGDVLKTY
eukprot:tig00001264_g7868.t1